METIKSISEQTDHLVKLTENQQVLLFQTDIPWIPLENCCQRREEGTVQSNPNYSNECPDSPHPITQDLESLNISFDEIHPIVVINEPEEDLDCLTPVASESSTEDGGELESSDIDPELLAILSRSHQISPSPPPPLPNRYRHSSWF